MALVLTLGQGETFNVAERKFLIVEVGAETVTVQEVGGEAVVLDPEEPQQFGDDLRLRQGHRVLSGKARIAVEAPKASKIWRNTFNLDAPIALLASVPLEHLNEGLETQARVGRVAFGSRAVDAFMTLKEELGEDPCCGLIYASDGPGGPPAVTWAGTFLRTVGARARGGHPEGDRYRPRSTDKYREDETGEWLLFWEVTDLRQLSPERQVKVSALSGFGKKSTFHPTFVPHGPVPLNVTRPVIDLVRG